MRLALPPSGLSREESRGLAGELKMTPGSPWQPEVAAQRLTVLAPLAPSFPRTGCLTKPEPKGEEEKSLGWFGQF